MANTSAASKKLALAMTAAKPMILHLLIQKPMAGPLEGHNRGHGVKQAFGLKVEKSENIQNNLLCVARQL